MEERAREAELERQELLLEINRLRSELSYYKPIESINGTYINGSSNLSTTSTSHIPSLRLDSQVHTIQNGIDTKVKENHNKAKENHVEISAPLRPINVIYNKPSHNAMSWISPIGLLGFFFMSSGAKSHMNERVIRV